MGDRIVALVDMDCFYVQVEQRLQPQYFNKPCAVVQYNAYQGGGIIAVSYEARAEGIKNGMRGNSCKKRCPGLHLFKVPELRGKADLTRYRDASVEVMEVLCEFGDCMERASVDEAYLDLTRVASERASSQDTISEDLLPSTFVVGYDTLSHDELVSDDTSTQPSNSLDIRGTGLRRWLNSTVNNLLDLRLAAAALIVEEIRAAVYKKTGFRCSAGISHNKMLAKLACGIHKPNNQTILPKGSVPLLFSTIAIHKVRNLGGKLGEEIKEKLSIETMGQLAELSMKDLQKHFGAKTALYLHELSHGVENEPVISRQLPKSIGCGKNFPGKNALSTESQIRHWLGQLAEELLERLTKDKQNNQRRATTLTVSFRRQSDAHPGSTSRSCPLHIYDYVRITQDAYDMIHKSTLDEQPQPIICLSMSAGKFQDTVETIDSFLSHTPRGLTQYVDETRHNTNCTGDTTASSALGQNAVKKRENSKGSVSNPKTSVMGFFAKKLQQHTEISSDDRVSASVGCLSNGITQGNLEEQNSVGENDNQTSSTAREVSNDSNPLIREQSTCNSNFNADSEIIDMMDLGEIDETVLPHLPKEIRWEVESYLRNKERKEMGFQKSGVNGTSHLQETVVSTLDSPSTSTLAEVGDEVQDIYGKDRCHKCHEMVPLDQLEEHADFHFAQELQAQMRDEERGQQQAATLKPKVSPVKRPSSSMGRRRGRGRPKKHVPVEVHKKMRKLESYFG